MPKDQQLSRQRPVSCRFCRSRKLRCSRDVPCSNCVSRGLRCELENQNPPPALRTSELDLLERIRKLEEAIAIQAVPHTGAPPAPAHHSDIPTPPSTIEHLDSDIAWLESIYSGPDLSDKIPSNKVVFRVCPIGQIMEAQPYIVHHATVPSTSPELLRCVWLPQYPEAKILLQKYIEDTDHVHHIVHTPSLPSILDEVYACLNQQSQLNPGSVILLLSIFGSATHCWGLHDCERGLFSAAAEANSQAPYWVKATEDVLDIAHRTTCLSIEGIQGIIISLFVSANILGFSRRCRYLNNMGLMLARELGLHLLDHPSNASLANSAQAEIGRRVWWYLVASDWAFAARFTGAAQGVYQCHMRHMLVKKPLNINDEDIRDGMSRIEQPLSQPTTMSYQLQRIRISEIARSIVDRAPFFMTHAGGISYDIIMDIDTELQSLLNDIPSFFSMSKSDLIQEYQLDPSRAAEIVHQGYILYPCVYSLRCKLHFPYLNRGFVDPAYASSRDICVRSARLIIQNETRLEHAVLCKSTRYKLMGLMIGVFMASIALLMDLCHCKSSPQEEKVRQEIFDAIRILEASRNDSDMAVKFLDSLMQVLRKHKVSPPKPTGKPPLEPTTDNADIMAAPCEPMDHNAAKFRPFPGSAMISSSSLPSSNGPENLQSTSIDSVGNGLTDGDEDLSTYFNNLAQSFEQGMDVGSFDWDGLLTGLDSSFI